MVVQKADQWAQLTVAPKAVLMAHQWESQMALQLVLQLALLKALQKVEQSVHLWAGD